MKDINDKKFTETISKGINLVDFWAPWCLPCHLQSTILKKLDSQFNNHVKITKLNIDLNKKTTENFKILSIPTLILFKDGKIKKRFSGLQTEENLINEINKLKTGEKNEH